MRKNLTKYHLIQFGCHQAVQGFSNELVFKIIGPCGSVLHKKLHSPITKLPYSVTDGKDKRI